MPDSSLSMLDEIGLNAVQPWGNDPENTCIILCLGHVDGFILDTDPTSDTNFAMNCHSLVKVDNFVKISHPFFPPVRIFKTYELHHMNQPMLGTLFKSFDLDL